MEALGRISPKFKNTGILKEFEDQKRSTRNSSEIYNLLKQLSLIRLGDSKAKQMLSKQLGLKKGRNYFKKDTLENLYNICINKMKNNDLSPFIRTTPEQEITTKLKDISRKKFINSAVIGNSVVDIFYPQHRLVIEIDGPIHNSEIKMRKDCHRDRELMEKLGILVMCFHNEDIYRGAHELQIFFDLDERLPDAQCKRLWRNVHMMTISKQMSAQELSNHLQLDVNGLIQNQKRIRKQGGLK